MCTFTLSSGTEEKKIEYGKASFYAEFFEGRKTANGEIFSNDELTAAHKELPMGTMVRVINIANGKSVEVRINDRGPFVDGRIIDLTERAFDEIAEKKLGVIEVSVEIF